MSFRVAAVVFDMDGVLIDTERLAYRAYCNAAAENGVSASEEFFLSLVGTDARTTERRVQEVYGERLPLEAIGRHAEEIRRSEGVPLKPGAREVLEYLRQCEIPCGLATSSYRAHMEQVLGELSLLQYFRATVTGDEVERGKPAPDIYARAVRLLGMEASVSVAVEDSAPGVLSAADAGLHVVHVPDMKPIPDEVAVRAQRIEPSLQHVLEYLRSIRE